MSSGPGWRRAKRRSQPRRREGKTTERPGGWTSGWTGSSPARPSATSSRRRSGGRRRRGIEHVPEIILFSDGLDRESPGGPAGGARGRTDPSDRHPARSLATEELYLHPCQNRPPRPLPGALATISPLVWRAPDHSVARGLSPARLVAQGEGQAPGATGRCLIRTVGVRRNCLRSEVLRSEHLTDIRLAVSGDAQETLRQLDRFLLRLGLDQRPAADQLSRLGEGPVGHRELTFGETNPHPL